MELIYKKWINKHVPTFTEAYGKCHKVCIQMNENFPELKIVRGWYKDYGLPSGKEKRTHWWLKKRNTIIDPTTKQFHLPNIIKNYEEFIIGKHKIPTGKCMNCGKLCYNGRQNSCCDRCNTELKKYYGWI